MSLILDALRKSDGQRTRQAAERLRDGPGAAQPQVLPRWLLGGLLASVLLLAVALFIAVQQDRPSPGDDRSAAGAGKEIMENEPALAVAVRPLAGELAGMPARITGDESAMQEVDRPPETRAQPVEIAADTAADIDDLNATPLSALPVEVRARLPRLHVDIHAWSEDPQARFVLINMRRYQEGDRLQEGPLLRRILPDGVVLDADGMLFSLPRQ